MIEFFETLIPFVPKLTKEAKDLLVEELVKNVELYEEEVREVLKKAMEGELAEESPKVGHVFRAFWMALKKEKGKKVEGVVEKEKEELKAIAPKSRKRENTGKSNGKTKRIKKDSKK